MISCRWCKSGQSVVDAARALDRRAGGESKAAMSRHCIHLLVCNPIHCYQYSARRYSLEGDLQRVMHIWALVLTRQFTFHKMYLLVAFQVLDSYRCSWANENLACSVHVLRSTSLGVLGDECEQQPCRLLHPVCSTDDQGMLCQWNATRLCP